MGEENPSAVTFISSGDQQCQKEKKVLKSIKKILREFLIGNPSGKMVLFGSEEDSLIGLQKYLATFGWLEGTSKWFVDISKEESLFSIR